MSVTKQLVSVPLAPYSIQPFPILAGTASDSSGQVEIVVRMISSEIGAQRTVIAVEDNQWSYIPEINDLGVYSLSLQARDIAGNLTSLGSWTLEVTDKYVCWLPVIYR